MGAAAMPGQLHKSKTESCKTGPVPGQSRAHKVEFTCRLGTDILQGKDASRQGTDLCIACNPAALLNFTPCHFQGCRLNAPRSPRPGFCSPDPLAAPDAQAYTHFHPPSLSVSLPPLASLLLHFRTFLPSFSPLLPAVHAGKPGGGRRRGFSEVGKLAL